MALSLEHLNCCMQVCLHAKRLSRSQLFPRKKSVRRECQFPSPESKKAINCRRVQSTAIDETVSLGRQIAEMQRVGVLAGCYRFSRSPSFVSQAFHRLLRGRG
jgi:hypothetical protein